MNIYKRVRRLESRIAELEERIVMLEDDYDDLKANKPMDKSGSINNRMIRFFRESGGEVLSRDLHKWAREQNISIVSLSRAKVQLGITVERVPGKRIWAWRYSPIIGKASQQNNDLKRHKKQIVDFSKIERLDKAAQNIEKGKYLKAKAGDFGDV